LGFKNPENIQYNLIEQVVNELRGHGKCVSTGASAARTNRILELVVKDKAL
jgi:acyl-CoA synthetase (AMP-forming)/AMP-acid ligase II